jgi:hypothetical protein
MSRNALADAVVVAVDQGRSAPVAGFAGRGDEITHVEQDRDDLADALVTWLPAEGVEMRDELDVLRTLDVHLAQGYYFGRPVPAEDVAAAVARSSARATQ